MRRISGSGGRIHSKPALPCACGQSQDAWLQLWSISCDSISHALSHRFGAIETILVRILRQYGEHGAPSDSESSSRDRSWAAVKRIGGTKRNARYTIRVLIQLRGYGWYQERMVCSKRSQENDCSDTELLSQRPTDSEWHKNMD